MNSDSKICADEREVLEMIAGIRPWERGAWVNACYEFLQDMGYVQRGGVLRVHQLTDKGKQELGL